MGLLTHLELCTSLGNCTPNACYPGAHMENKSSRMQVAFWLTSPRPSVPASQDVTALSQSLIRILRAGSLGGKGWASINSLVQETRKAFADPAMLCGFLTSTRTSLRWWIAGLFKSAAVLLFHLASPDFPFLFEIDSIWFCRDELSSLNRHASFH